MADKSGEKPSTSGRAPRQRNIRTKRVDDEQEEQQEESQQGEFKDKLEETKLLHKLRKKVGGTTSDKLAQGEKKSILPVVEEVEAQEPTKLMEAYVKEKRVEVQDEDQHMSKFIELELAKRLGKRLGGDDAAQDAEAKRQKMEEELYAIPEEYKSKLSGEVALPGLMTAITEVALPADVRMGNIEATERMKQALLLARGHRLPEEPVPVDPSKETQMNVRRREFAFSFGKQQAKPKDRDAAEDEARRMRYVSENRPVGKARGKG